MIISRQSLCSPLSTFLVTTRVSHRHHRHPAIAYTAMPLPRPSSSFSLIMKMNPKRRRIQKIQCMVLGKILSSNTNACIYTHNLLSKKVKRTNYSNKTVTHVCVLYKLLVILLTSVGELNWIDNSPGHK